MTKNEDRLSKNDEKLPYLHKIYKRKFVVIDKSMGLCLSMKGAWHTQETMVSSHKHTETFESQRSYIISNSTNFSLYLGLNLGPSDPETDGLS